MRFNLIGLVAVPVVFALAVTTSPGSAAGQAPAFKLEGKWKYQSFRPEPTSLPAVRDCRLFKAWSPPGDVTIDASGKGTLVFKLEGGTDLTLDLTCVVSDPVAPATATRLWVRAVKPLGGGREFTNELQGFLVPQDLATPTGKQVFRGTIVQTSADIAPKDPQPQFTTGFFVLEPAM